jgi:lipopolysaccharide biosynthesis protein
VNEAETKIERRARVLAFYLPQFHPVPENNDWWGAGFTEWTNAAKARPLFRGHRQPHLPADLGFYDLRLPEAREEQAALARQYVIEAFCYWHYWFAGRRILERPYTEMLESGRPDLSFCLAWANQTWSGIWYDEADRVLIEQTYPGADDDRAHFEHVLPAFRDNRYFRVDGKPLFYLFRPELHPEPAAFVERWQKMAAEAGLGGLYLVAEISDLLGGGPKYATFAEDGFDAGVYMRIPAVVTQRSVLRMRFDRKVLRRPEHYEYAREPIPAPPELRSDSVHPCVYPNWDNTPRSGRRGLVITESSPARFRRHVRAAVDSIAHRSPDHRLLFIKSWNEWAEGNYLEPDLDHGHGFLKALAEEIGSKATPSGRTT